MVALVGHSGQHSPELVEDQRVDGAEAEDDASYDELFEKLPGNSINVL